MFASSTQETVAHKRIVARLFALASHFRWLVALRTGAAIAFRKLKFCCVCKLAHARWPIDKANLIFANYETKSTFESIQLRALYARSLWLRTMSELLGDSMCNAFNWAEPANYRETTRLPRKTVRCNSIFEKAKTQTNAQTIHSGELLFANCCLRTEQASERISAQKRASR